MTYSSPMSIDNMIRRFDVEHIQWCREERARLGESLVRYQDGTLSIGEGAPGKPMTQGSLTHIMYLQRTMQQLSEVIAAFEP